jgi:hypothetical protein
LVAVLHQHGTNLGLEELDAYGIRLGGLGRNDEET